MAYITSQGEELLKGSVRIDPDPDGASGILCACCATVISCSQFEAHAGRGSRRAPYDNIFTADGLSLRKVRRASCARIMEWRAQIFWQTAYHVPAEPCEEFCNFFPMPLSSGRPIPGGYAISGREAQSASEASVLTGHEFPCSGACRWRP